MVFRKELLEYDCCECKGLESFSSGFLLLMFGLKGLFGECYGCVFVVIEYCVIFLRVLVMVFGICK